MSSLNQSDAGFPEPPYYAVIFTSQRSDADPDGYDAMADRMASLAREQAGYLGIESYRDPTGIGVTISYWSSLEDIRTWRNQAEHRVAQSMGKNTWYSSYSLRVCKVEESWRFVKQS